MHMIFKWDGSDPGVEYRVTEYTFSVNSQGGETKLSNCQPGQINLTLELPPEPHPGKEFFQFAAEQHDTSGDKGKGTLTVFKGKSVGESLQEISFEDGWVTTLSLNVAEKDDKFQLKCNIAAAKVMISESEFVHHRRAEHFQA